MKHQKQTEKFEHIETKSTTGVENGEPEAEQYKSIVS